MNTVHTVSISRSFITFVNIHQQAVLYRKQYINIPFSSFEFKFHIWSSSFWWILVHKYQNHQGESFLDGNQ